jgi:hypothetical protein
MKRNVFATLGLLIAFSLQSWAQDSKSFGSGSSGREAGQAQLTAMPGENVPDSAPEQSRRSAHLRARRHRMIHASPLLAS